MLSLLVAAFCALRPAIAQDLPSPEARRSEIIRLVLEYGDKHFAAQWATTSSIPREAYLMRDSEGRPSYAEGSLEYAAALLTSRVSTEQAAHILDAVLSAQAIAGSEKGSFPWRPNTGADPYATAYLAPWLAYLHQHFANALPADTRTRLAQSLEPALASVLRFDARPEDTRAFLVKVAAEAMLASALKDPEAASRAAADMNTWLKYASENGFPIAQRPTATVVAVAALHWIWLAAPTEDAKRSAAAALEYLYRDLALRSQPKAGMVAGVGISARYADYATGTGATRYLLYAQFGRPELTFAEPFAMFLTVPGFTPSEETVALARAVDAPRTVCVRSGDRHLTTYVHPRYALATMSGPVEAGTVPIVVTYGSPGKPGAYCTVAPVPARVATVQDASRALVSFDFDGIGYEDDRLFVSAEFHLGLKSTLDSVLINQGRYTEAYAAAVETRASVITECAGVYTAVTPIIIGPASAMSYDETPRPGELAWTPTADGKDSELILRIVARSVRAREKPRDNYRLGLAVELGSRDDFRTVEDFAKAIDETRRVKGELKTKRVKIGEKTDDAHRPPMYNRPVERGNWIIETRVMQTLTFTADQTTLQLVEDLQQNQVVAQTVNGVEAAWDFLYRSPALNQMPGDALDSVLRPPPAPGRQAGATIVLRER